MLLAAKGLLAFLIPDEPSWVRTAIAKVEYQARHAWMKQVRSYIRYCCRSHTVILLLTVHVGCSYFSTVIITHSDMDDLWRFPQRLLDAKAKKRCKAPKLPVETIEPSVVQPEPAVNVDDVTVS